jgi:ectoine hydroxylase
MALTEAQLQQYDELGYVVLPALFSAEEIALLRREADLLETDRRGHPDANTYEKNGRIRAAWAMEIDSSAYDAACRDPRVLEPVMQLLGGPDIYLLQSRLNFKVAHEGDVFQWHQDYASWEQDGVPDGDDHKVLTVLVMLDDTDALNGPLRFVPGSHREGVIRPEYDETTTSYALHVVPDSAVSRLTLEMGVFANTGPAGTVAIFSGNLVHGSTKNRSPHGRRNAYFAYNRLDNAPTVSRSQRKTANDYIANFDPKRVEPLARPVLPELSRRSA